jgi:hypothetical protein
MVLWDTGNNNVGNTCNNNSKKYIGKDIVKYKITHGA